MQLAQSKGDTVLHVLILLAQMSMHRGESNQKTKPRLSLEYVSSIPPVPTSLSIVKTAGWKQHTKSSLCPLTQDLGRRLTVQSYSSNGTIGDVFFRRDGYKLVYFHLQWLYSECLDTASTLGQCESALLCARSDRSSGRVAIGLRHCFIREGC